MTADEILDRRGRASLGIAAVGCRCSIEQRVFLLRRLHGAAVRGAGHRVEHPRRLRRLRELRHRAFFGLGAYTAVVLFKALGAPLAVQIAGAAVVGGLLGFGVGMLTLRLRGIFFAIATVALVFIMETLIINWRYVGGATGLQLLRPPATGAVRQLHAACCSW